MVSLELLLDLLAFLQTAKIAGDPFSAGGVALARHGEDEAETGEDVEGRQAFSLRQVLVDDAQLLGEVREIRIAGKDAAAPLLREADVPVGLVADDEDVAARRLAVEPRGILARHHGIERRAEARRGR